MNGAARPVVRQLTGMLHRRTLAIAIGLGLSASCGFDDGGAAIDAAAIDAAAIDGAVDAAIDATEESWPPAQVLAPSAQLAGTSERCLGLGRARLAVGVLNTTASGTMVTTVAIDGAAVSADVTMPPSSCAVAVSAGGELVYAFAASSFDTRLHLGATITADVGAVTDIVAIDPGGGLVVRAARLPAVARLVRLTDALAVDEGFGTAGEVALPDAVRGAVVHDGATPTVTVRLDDALVRLALRTGAAVTGFGTGGRVALGVDPARLLAMIALADGGVALAYRTDAAAAIAIDRLDATGARTTQTVALPAPPIAAHADDSGRLTIAFAATPDRLHLVRLDAATGAIDRSFGLDGRATVSLPTTCDDPSDAALVGALGDGRLIFRRTFRCAAMPPVPAQNVVSYYALPSA